MMSWCTGCHSSAVSVDNREGAPTSVNLESIEGVWQYADRIQALGNHRSADDAAGGRGQCSRAGATGGVAGVWCTGVGYPITQQAPSDDERRHGTA